MPTVLETSKVPGLRLLYGLSLVTAALAGGFCAVFLAVLVYFYHAAAIPVAEPTPSTTSAEGVPPISSDPTYRQPAGDPFNRLPTDQPAFRDLKRQLAADRNNEPLTERLRQLDRQLRVEFFKRRELVDRMTPLLLISSVVFLIAAKTASVLKREIPIPKAETSESLRRAESGRLRWGSLSVCAISLLLLGLALGLVLAPPSPFEAVLAEKRQTRTPDSAPAATPVFDSKIATSDAATTDRPESGPAAREEPPPDRDVFLREAARNWPSFRGFDGRGVRRAPEGEPEPPIRWNATTGENILWASKVPLPGKSSPVVWDNRLFLSGADESQRRVFCFETETGRLLWSADAPPTPENANPPQVSEDTGYAAPTMVVDGHRAFALFANGDLVATDFDGRILWHRNLGVPESAYGFASSPALYFDRLIVQYDVGDGTDGKSKLYAFDVRTGRTVWETAREIPNSWSSPMIVAVGGRVQVVTCGDPYVIAYDPETGEEIWRCRCLANDVGPSPAAFGDVVFVANQGPRTTAIDATGTGDVTATHILWQGANALPDTASPFATAERLFTLDSGGYLTAYDPANVSPRNKRAAFWELEIGGGEARFYSSPLLVGRRVYLFSMTEKTPGAAEGTGPAGYVVDLSGAETDDAGALTGTAAMIVATNPMTEPCVTSPAVVGGRLFIRGSETIFCIGDKP